MKELRCTHINSKGFKCNNLLLKYEGELKNKIEVKCKSCKKITEINKEKSK